MPASVVHVPMFLLASLLAWYRALCDNVSSAFQLLIFTYQRDKPTKCHKTCQCFNLACKRANSWTWRANVPESIPIFPTCFLRNAKGNFYALLLYKKFIILDIILIRIMCMCIVHKNCTILHFYTFHVILKKIVWNFGFLKLFALYLEMKI